VVRRHGHDRSGGEGCGYAASLGQRKRVAHIPTAETEAARSGLIFLKDKSRSGYTLSPAFDGPTIGVHFNVAPARLAFRGAKAAPTLRGSIRNGDLAPAPFPRPSASCIRRTAPPPGLSQNVANFGVEDLASQVSEVNELAPRQATRAKLAGRVRTRPTISPRAGSPVREVDVGGEPYFGSTRHKY